MPIALARGEYRLYLALCTIAPPRKPQCLSMSGLASRMAQPTAHTDKALAWLAHNGLITVADCTCAAFATQHVRVETKRNPPEVVEVAKSADSRATAVHRAGMLAKLQRAAAGRAAVCLVVTDVWAGIDKETTRQRFHVMVNQGLIVFAVCYCDAVPRSHTRVTFLPASGHVTTDFGAPSTGIPRPARLLAARLAAQTAPPPPEPPPRIASVAPRGPLPRQKVVLERRELWLAQVWNRPVPAAPVPRRQATKPPPREREAKVRMPAGVSAAQLEVLERLKTLAEGHATLCGSARAMLPELDHGTLYAALAALRAEGYLTSAPCRCPLQRRVHSRVVFLPKAGLTVTSQEPYGLPGPDGPTRNWWRAGAHQRILQFLRRSVDKALTLQQINDASPLEKRGRSNSLERRLLAMRADGLVTSQRGPVGRTLYWRITDQGLAVAVAMAPEPQT